MNRREVLAAAGLGAVGSMLGLGDGYRPVGSLAAGMLGASDVDRVTLDGVTVEHVTELDDVAGWVKYEGPNPEIEDGRLHFRTYHATGTVRVYWRRT